MSTRKLSNIPLKEFQAFLELAGCTYIHTKGGHEKWTRSDLFRPIIIQSHIDPVPERIARNLIKLLGLTREDYHDIMDGKKKVKKEKERYVVVKG
ncbi:MAG: type II toxin-antitoxin system HicA family toxin [Flavobacteriales bacterium]|nr:type II toxin-antitoxin system HicA family toxin [Flavobacteriales bacterium]